MGKEFGIIDTFFKVPIRITSVIDDRKKRAEMDIEPILGETRPIFEPPFVIGQRCIPYSIAKNLHWEDSFSDNREIEDIESKGFDHTTIITQDGEYISCAWKREKFEQRYSSYLEEMDAFLDAREDIASKKRQEENKLMFIAVTEEEENKEEKE